MKWGLESNRPTLSWTLDFLYSWPCFLLLLIDLDFASISVKFPLKTHYYCMSLTKI